MQIIYHQLSHARSDLAKIEDGEIDHLFCNDLGPDDIAKLIELVKMTGTAEEVVHGLRVVSRDEGYKILALARHFGIVSREQEDLVEVLEEDEIERPYRIRFYIREHYTCKVCGAQVPPFKNECKKHFDEKKGKELSSATKELNLLLVATIGNIFKTTRDDIKRIDDAAERFIRARDEQW